MPFCNSCLGIPVCNLACKGDRTYSVVPQAGFIPIPMVRIIRCSKIPVVSVMSHPLLFGRAQGWRSQG